LRALLLAAATLAVAAPASAALFDLPVPANAYISFAGLNWAWASPCGPSPVNACDPTAANYLSFQGGQGWRLPTPVELAVRPSASVFLFAGANVPAFGFDPVTMATFFGANRTDGACAAPYFSGLWRNCDFADGVAGLVNGGDFGETWFVRDVRDPNPEPVPAPTALALLGLGLAGLALRRR